VNFCWSIYFFTLRLFSLIWPILSHFIWPKVIILSDFYRIIEFVIDTFSKPPFCMKLVVLALIVWEGMKICLNNVCFFALMPMCVCVCVSLQIVLVCAYGNENGEWKLESKIVNVAGNIGKPALPVMPRQYQKLYFKIVSWSKFKTNLL